MQIRSLWSRFAIRALAVWAPVLTSTSAFAMNAQLAWSVVPAATGYKIYERVSGGAYGTGMDVGAQQAAADGAVHFTVANIGVGTFVAVTSYDASGLESTRSNELAVPAAPSATATVPPPVVTTPVPIGPSATHVIVTSPTATA